MLWYSAMSNPDAAAHVPPEELTWSGEANPEKLSGEDVRGLLWLILAEADHPFGRRELFQTVRDKLDPKRYVRPGDQRVRNLMSQELLAGHADRLAFRDRVRLTPAGLRELEAAKPHYRKKIAFAGWELVRAASERVPDRRTPGRETQVRVDNTLAGGLSVSWTNFEAGLIRLEGTDLMGFEKPLLPNRYARFGTLHLVERRLEFGDPADGQVAETLVFDYPGTDPDAGRRRYGGLPVPNMQTEIHRERVPLGTLRQLTAELTGAPQQP